MNDARAELARVCGVATSYPGPGGETVHVGRETLVAVLGALGFDASTPGAAAEALNGIAARREARLVRESFLTRRLGEPAVSPEGAASLDGLERRVVTESGVRIGADAPLPLGLHTLEVRGRGREESVPVLVAPRRLDAPEGDRAWGFMVQLYAMRSRGSWGMGDLRDLSDLATWSAERLGAGFVLVNPVHATEPAVPISPSPYLPVSRRFASPLYLRIEDIPEFAALGRDARRRIEEIAGAQRAVVTTADDLDRDAVWRAKLAALEILSAVSRTPAREAAYREFAAREEPALTDFATWNALAELHGADIRTWPAALRDKDGPAVRRARTELGERVEFHRWTQWLCDERLTAAQRAATGAGMSIGILNDLAVGASGGGADAWMYADALARGVSVGAPPDAFNQRGQDWAQPPWHPRRLADQAYAPLRDMVRYGLRHGGGLRVDHVMGMYRLWWIPEGARPAEGTYVSYDAAAMMGAVTLEAARTGGIVVGEDLGTVEPHVRDDLADRGVYGTSMLWFERDAGGAPRAPGTWRAQCLATVDSHDLPPIAEYLSGAHVALRARLGLLTRDAADEEADARAQVAAWTAALRGLGLLGDDPGEWETVLALHAYLAATPARLVGVSLADAVGERRSQNLPGTSDAYPNWRVPLADGKGTPVLLDDVMADPGVRELAEVLRAAGKPVA
ncbi:MAG TPA: 4-alpha-glucanotransferase [Streptosporangiaceae bacterium]